MKDKKLPKILDDQPTEYDAFGSGGHAKIAEAIKAYIDHSEVERKVIGLEGEWGSGKSTIVKIIKQKVDEIVVIELDLWENQSNLSSLFILKYFKDSLLERLKEFSAQNVVKNDEKTNENFKTLVTEIHQETTETPFEIKKPIFFLLLSIISFLGLKSIGELLREYHVLVNLIWEEQSEFFIFHYGLPTLFFVIAFIMAFLNKSDLFNTTSNFIQLYFFGKSGKSTKISQFTKVGSDSQQYREFIHYMDKELLPSFGDKKTIFVLDDIDRLPYDKQIFTWDLINTLFSKPDYSNFWVLIPFKEIESGGSVLSPHYEKIFGLVFNVPSISLNYSSAYFKTVFEESFENENFAVLYKVFNRKSKLAEKTPRGIIKFINYLATKCYTHNEQYFSGQLTLLDFAIYYFGYNGVGFISVEKPLEEKKPISSVISDIREFVNHEKQFEIGLKMIMIQFNIDRESAVKINQTNALTGYILQNMPKFEGLDNFHNHADQELILNMSINQLNFDHNFQLLNESWKRFKKLTTNPTIHDEFIKRVYGSNFFGQDISTMHQDILGLCSPKVAKTAVELLVDYQMRIFKDLEGDTLDRIKRINMFIYYFNYCESVDFQYKSIVDSKGDIELYSKELFYLLKTGVDCNLIFKKLNFSYSNSIVIDYFKDVKGDETLRKELVSSKKQLINLKKLNPGLIVAFEKWLITQLQNRTKYDETYLAFLEYSVEAKISLCKHIDSKMMYNLNDVLQKNIGGNKDMWFAFMILNMKKINNADFKVLAKHIVSSEERMNKTLSYLEVWYPNRELLDSHLKKYRGIEGIDYLYKHYSNS